MSGEAVALWLVRLDDVAEPLTALELRDPLSPPGELDGLDATRRIARIALRRLLSQMFGRDLAQRPFEYGAHGKPVIPGLAGDFNLSHSAASQQPRALPALALIGLGHATAIGVDLESLRPVRLDAKRRSSILDAAVALADGAPLPPQPDLAIIQAWARLEAWGKANGMGIGRTLRHFGIWGTSARSSVSLNHPHDYGPELTVRDVAVPDGLFAAVALPRDVAVPAVKVMAADAATLEGLQGLGRRD